jgi:dihydrofolate reductase
MSQETPQLALIWAMARNRVIGRANALPWRLPADMAHFKALTTGHPVLMGRRTFESLGRPLPQRTNIVISTDPGFAPSGCLVAHSLGEALELGARHAATSTPPVLFVIGGENLYRQTLPAADRLYVTLVEAELPGDARFPEFDWDDWLEIERRRQPQDDKNPYPCTFLTLVRRPPVATRSRGA